jgi:hypothetical protein
VQYYTFKKSDKAKNPCVIMTWIGLFQYNAAQTITWLCSRSDRRHISWFRWDVKVHIDNIGFWLHKDANSAKLETKVPTQSQDNCLAVNLLKCEWRIFKETDWLGNWLAPHGFKAWKKKVEAILEMQGPENIQQVCSFIGAISFYHDMFLQSALIICPLDRTHRKS